jgi:NAD(P)-dependent dehydrogenase (short-subunit alcohol dehydrogenase family)
MSTFVITGANRGFGLHIAREALAAGHRVVATARHPESLLEQLPGAGDSLLALPLDVTDAASVATAVETAVSTYGGVDVLVNNAGRGLLGAVEEVSDAEARAVFDVNLFGLLEVTRAVLPVMRRAGSGTIVNISSSGGIVGRPGWGVYCATKFAVEGISEALRLEAEPLGVRVVAVEPGAFRTDFLDASSLVTAESTIDEYHQTAGATRVWADDNNHAQAGDPAKAAQIIVGLPERPELPARIQLGADCFTAVEAKLAQTAADQQTWRDVSLSTSH